MKKNTFDIYSSKHIHFYDLSIPKLLEELIKSENKSFFKVGIRTDFNFLFMGLR